MNKKNLYTPVRFSHLTTYAGVGAIVRGVEDRLMVAVDTRFWTDRNGQISSEIIPYVERIKMALNIDKDLRMPPNAREDGHIGIQGSSIPAVLFPTYAVCNKCGLLHNNPWRKREIRFTEKLKCDYNSCNGRLEQVTWCAVSNKGYLDDVPWHAICHIGENGNCRLDFDLNYLKLDIDDNGKKIVKCLRCGSSGYYDKARTRIINKEQPWIGQSPKLAENDLVEILEVNNPGVYLPISCKALVIPPESRISKSTVIDQIYNNAKIRSEIDGIRNPLLRNGKLKLIATRYRCNVREVEDALDDIAHGYPFLDEIVSAGDILEDEYLAFLMPLDNLREDEDFVTEHKSKEWKNLSSNELSSQLSTIIKLIDNLIIARRLRELLIFVGFQRGFEGELKKKDERGNEKKILIERITVPPDIVGESDWLPSIELFGEGVFFTLNESFLSDWEVIPGVRQRADEIANRYEKTDLKVTMGCEEKEPIITARFILLHTLSHLLIRELESTAGYPAASLAERIYCSKDRKMSGILIYTSVADIAGSLGGIIESAQPKEFLKILAGTFLHAEWCSLDPVCSEHQGQGPGWLNRAACHACSLIPEPSCEYSNIFLDRVFIKGDEKLGIPRFLDFVMTFKSMKK